MVLLLHAVNAMPFLAVAKTGQGEQRIEKVKADVARRGTGEKARVKVKLQDGSNLKGYISQAGDDSFTLTDSKTGQATTLAYRDVAQVKKPGGLSMGAKIGIGLGIAVGALGLVYVIGCGNDPFC
jgi:hypothetical protein